MYSWVALFFQMMFLAISWRFRHHILFFFMKYSFFSKKNLYFCACVSAIVIRDRELRPWIELNTLHLKLKLWPIWLAIIRRLPPSASVR